VLHIQKQTLHAYLWAAILLCSLVSAFVSNSVLAEPRYHPQKKIELNDGVNKYQVNNLVRVLEDKNGELTIQDILQPGKIREFEFIPNRGALNFGYTDSSYWIALPVQYKGQKALSEWWYQLDLPLLDKSELYIVPSGIKEPASIIKKQMDYDIPLKKREINHVTQVYRINLKKEEQVTLYLKVKSDFSMHLPLFLYSPEGFVDSVAVEELLYGCFLGALWILIVYNFFMYMSVREPSFLFYILYILFYMLFLVTERVHGLSIFGDIPAFFHKDNLALYIWVAWIFALLLARSFLETKAREPDLDGIIKVFISVAAVSAIITQFLDSATGIQWSVLGTLLYGVLMVWLAYAALKRGNPMARFYFMAWSLNFGGVILYGLTVTGNIPFNFMTSNSPHIGIVAQMVIISLALADRIKMAQRQTAKANQQSMVNLKRYRSLFDNAVEGIFQISLERRFIDANPAMANMLGYRSPELLIQSVGDAFSVCYPQAEDQQKVVTLIEQGDEIQEVEARYTGKNGEECWASSTVRIIYDKHHAPLHLEGTFVDITERVESERVEREREQERLQKDVAEASAAAKSQFLANMSHEIRTPLTAIIGYGESLLDETLSEDEKRESSEVVVRSGKHLLALINDILDHSKIDADKLDTEIVTVNLFVLLNEVKAYFSPKAAEKNVDFNIQYDFPLPEEIQTDPTRLRQILINLCGNALKFTDRGSISLIVRCERPVEILVIKVVDTGVGVKPEQIKKLFDPFAQASPTVARQYGGTGLGLSISRRLAEMLGGDITAASIYGEGSEFEVTIATGSLQTAKFARNQSDLNLKAYRPATTEAPKLVGRVLYAEDNEINRRLIKQLVNKTGASISLVTNGAEALEVATRNGESFDLILMDIQMPVMDGRDATVAIREAGVNTPIVAVTANVMLEDKAEYKEAGCNEVMAKPVEKAPFYKMLGRYLKMDRRGLKQTKGIDKGSKSVVEKQLRGKVLVAEDNADNRLLIRRYLNRMGVDVLLAEDGRQAVSMAMRESINLILMDQHMPEMDGPEAAVLLRQAGFSRPILAFTASDDKKEYSMMMEAGCNGIVDKPVNPDQLFKVLSEHLSAATDSGEDDGNDDPWKDPDILPIVRHFVLSIPQRTALMKTAFKDEEWDTLRGQAHQVKGTAGSLGFPALTIEAKNLEMAIRNEETDNLNALLDALLTAADSAIERFNIQNPEQ